MNGSTVALSLKSQLSEWATFDCGTCIKNNEYSVGVHSLATCSCARHSELLSKDCFRSLGLQRTNGCQELPSRTSCFSFSLLPLSNLIPFYSPYSHSRCSFEAKNCQHHLLDGYQKIPLQQWWVSRCLKKATFTWVKWRRCRFPHDLFGEMAWHFVWFT